MCCGDITNVAVEGNKFVAKTTEEFNYNMISQEYAKKEIEKALRWQGLYYEFQPVLEEKLVDVQKVDIEKLSNIFGDLLIIK